MIRNKFGSADNINTIRALENAVSTSLQDEVSSSVIAASSLNAGNSNSLPGHTSQVSHLVHLHFRKRSSSNCDVVIVSSSAFKSAASQTTAATATSQGSGGGKYTSEEGSECGSSVTSESIPGGLHMSPRHNAAATNLGLSLGLESFFQELQERREEVDRLREEMEHLKVAPIILQCLNLP